MSQTNTDERLHEGTVVDNRYRIVSLLGSGGFANVYLATHEMLGTEVAIKVLHAPLAASNDGQFAKRFEREAKVAAQMRHPNVVNVTDFGFLDGSGDPYIVMEYLRGRDLREELDQIGPVQADRLLRLMLPCIQAVGQAHDAGVVHKDLKPSNLFLVDAGTPGERLVVLDFGVARVFDDADANITQTGAFTGTPAYLPPEYIREQRVTTAFDVYQMGLILIESLTGRPAVEADGAMGYLLAHCMGRLTVSPEFFDNELGRVLQKAIAVEDTARYPDCGALAADLATVAPPAKFEPARHTVERAAPSTAEVAVFADTVNSGQIVGDAFVTGNGGAGVAQSRISQSQMSTQERTAPVKSNRGLIAIAVVVLLGVVVAGVFAVSLLGERGESPDPAVAESGADRVAAPIGADPAAAPTDDDLELEFMAEPAVDEADTVLGESLEGAGRVMVDALAASELAAAEAARSAARESRAAERKKRRREKAREPVAKKPRPRAESKPEPKEAEKKETKAKTKPLLIVD